MVDIFKYLASGKPAYRCYAVTFGFEEGIPTTEVYCAVEAAILEVLAEKTITDQNDIEFVNRAFYQLTNLLIPPKSMEQRRLIAGFLSLLDVVQRRFGEGECPGCQYARFSLGKL